MHLCELRESVLNLGSCWNAIDRDLCLLHSGAIEVSGLFCYQFGWAAHFLTGAMFASTEDDTTRPRMRIDARYGHYRQTLVVHEACSRLPAHCNNSQRSYAWVRVCRSAVDIFNTGIDADFTWTGCYIFNQLKRDAD